MRWRKSSFSGQDTNCVEVAYTGDAVGVRDSKSPAAQLAVSQAAWRAFLRVTRR
jgi:Domain of unknown function (DUF397)